ncbi:hypothetical protein [Chitiniphilus shinanonensis]|uniref:hypothetical protein n=1 Tax=Chitiniphilus shinanonensis TaxID=553088 RepID=UPI00303CF41B
MNNLSTLANQVQGLAEAFRVMAYELDRQGLLDRQRLQARLRIHADENPAMATLPAAAQVLNSLADTLLTDFLTARGQSPEQIAAAMTPDRTGAVTG